jgi:hypothetical protein
MNIEHQFRDRGKRTSAIGQNPSEFQKKKGVDTF